MEETDERETQKKRLLQGERSRELDGYMYIKLVSYRIPGKSTRLHLTGKT